MIEGIPFNPLQQKTPQGFKPRTVDLSVHNPPLQRIRPVSPEARTNKPQPLITQGTAVSVPIRILYPLLSATGLSPKWLRGNQALLNDRIGKHFVMQSGAYVSLSRKQCHCNEQRFVCRGVIGTEISIFAFNSHHCIVLRFHVQHLHLSQRIYFMIS